ncbi:MAG TPA: laccase domain-containing protein, partial [Nocardioides sp.]|nr:laccase domain-containing protein [Nocardioides sp.]
RSAVSEVVPEAWSVTSWDTPAVDLGAGVRTQLAAVGVDVVHELGGCTREDDRFPSHRRDGERATRFAGVVWMRS